MTRVPLESDGDAIVTLCRGATNDVWRLQTRESYGEDDCDPDALRLWRQGQHALALSRIMADPLHRAFETLYLGLGGPRLLTRVALISKKPPSDDADWAKAHLEYFNARFENTWTVDPARLAEHTPLPQNDFILFDSTTVLKIFHDTDGTLEGGELLTAPDDVAPFVALRSLVMVHARRLELKSL